MTVPLATKSVDDEGRTVLRFERRLAHAPDKVWRAVTEPSELAHWFPAKIEAYELRPGARRSGSASWIPTSRRRQARCSRPIRPRCSRSAGTRT